MDEGKNSGEYQTIQPDQACFAHVEQQRKLRYKRLKILTLVMLSVLIVVLGTVPPEYSMLFLANLKKVLSLSLYFGLRAKKAPSLNITPTPVTPIPPPNRPATSSLRGPVIDRNFADPCFIEVNGTYYAFATNKYVIPQPGNINVQLAVSSDFDDWSLTTKDALPKVGAWAMDGLVWAPDVVQLVCEARSTQIGYVLTLVSG